MHGARGIRYRLLINGETASKMNLIHGVTVLLVFQLIGELSVRALQLSVPGPVAGMLLLLVLLVVRRDVPTPLDRTASGLLAHLSLLFVPAGVGIMVHAERIGAAWLPVLLTLLLSTVLTMAATAWAMLWLQRLLHTEDDDA